MKTPSTIDKNEFKWLLCPVLAVVIFLQAVPVMATGHQAKLTDTTTVTQETGSESTQEGETSSENSDLIKDALVPIDSQEVATATDVDWMTTKPYVGEVLHGGYVGFKNKASGKYLTIPSGTTALGTNVCQQNQSIVSNAQEFFLEYTYNPTSYEAYFHIFSVDLSGVKKLPVKLEYNYPQVGNVLLNPMSYLYTSERWQIMHVVDNYYCIYLASNPGASGTKFALTANSGNGTVSGTSTLATGNVYVSAYTGAANQLWQICADGNPITLENAIDISSDTPVLDIQKGQVSYAFYIPKQFNDTIQWQVSNTIKAMAYVTGGCYGFYAGSFDFIAMITHSDNSIDTYTCQSYVYLPSGAYSICSVDDLYLDTQQDWASIGSFLVLEESENADESNRTQLFRIAYVGNGQYLISSMLYHANQLSIESNSGNVMIRELSELSYGLKWELDENYSGCSIKMGGSSLCWTVDSLSGDIPILKCTGYTNASNQRWNLNREFESMLGIEYIDPLDSVVLHNYRALEVITYSTTLDDINVTWSSLDLNTYFQDNTVSLVLGRSVGEAHVRANVSNSSMQMQKDFSIWVIPAFDGYYSIKNIGSGESISTDSYLQGAQLEANAFCQTEQTGWYLEYAFDGYYRIKSAYNDLYLNATIYSVNQTQQSLLSTYWRFVGAQDSSSTDPRYNMINLSEQLEGKVLSVSFDSDASVIMDDETNINYYLDEWNLIPWGREAYMLGILDRTTGHDHDSVFYEIQDELSMLGYTYQTVRSADYMFLEDIEAVLSSVKFFVYRGHGISLVDKTGISNGSISFFSTSIYDFNNEEPILDMSECDIALFVGCDTGNHATQSLPDAAVKAGADCAIGFTTSIYCSDANRWLEEFISYYVAAEGDVDAALAGMIDADIVLSSVVKKVG